MKACAYSRQHRLRRHAGVGEFGEFGEFGENYKLIHDDMFNRFERTSVRNRQTDGQTDGHSILSIEFY